jgi:succinoglycan biosynthesis protein ExoO
VNERHPPLDLAGGPPEPELDPGLAGLAPEQKEANGVTIVIPTWHHREFLPRAIRSALAGLDELARVGVAGEVLVLDDASRDGSPRLLRSLEAALDEPRLITVLLEGNLGLPRLRNLGLRLARFRYALIHDADNELLPANLPLFFESIVATGAAFVHGNLLVRSGATVVGLRSGDVASARLYERNYLDAFALVDAARILELGGYATSREVEGWEDWELVLHLLAEEQRLVFVPLVLGWYERLPESMSRRLSARKDARLAALRRMYQQSGPRDWLPFELGAVYHPATGYLAQAGAAESGD